MIKIKKHFILKTTMYNIIMFRKIIFEILTRNTSITTVTATILFMSILNCN